MRLVLASGSPARLATLRAAGVEPEVVVSGVDEDGVTADSPAELASVLAVSKAEAVAALPTSRDALVLGCDSLLDLCGEALGKPADGGEATSRWRRMRGRSGVLVTGHCLIDVASRRQQVDVARTTVHFADLDDDEIDAYVDTGEPLAVAGAFTIDGLGGAYVGGIEGDHHNVVGISLPLVRLMMRDLGYSWHRLWNRLPS